MDYLITWSGARQGNMDLTLDKDEIWCINVNEYSLAHYFVNKVELVGWTHVEPIQLQPT